MKILVISASARAESQSRRFAEYLLTRVSRLADAELIDLNKTPLPIYDDSETMGTNPNWLSIKSKLEVADGYVVVSPEWNGMASVAYKNMMLFVGHEMAVKPLMICAVSSGRGGVHVIDELRLSGIKNSHIIISSENVIAQDCKDLALDDNWEETSKDYRFKSRAEYSLKMLVEYSKALQGVRASGVIDFEHYGSGV